MWQKFKNHVARYTGGQKVSEARGWRDLTLNLYLVDSARISLR